MNIAIFTDSFLPKIDGVAIATADLAKGLANLGHKVIIIAPRSKGLKKEFVYKNIKVIRTASIPNWFYPGLRITSIFNWKVFHLLKNNKIDIIHYQTQSTLGIEAILISRVLNLPLVGSFHVNIADKRLLKHGRLDFKFVENVVWKYQKTLYSFCDIIICPSEETKRNLLQHSFNRPIKVISNSIDLKLFNNLNAMNIKRKYNADGPIILYVGRISNEKNLPLLLESMVLVIDKRPDVKLILVGDGPQANEVKNKIISLGLSKKVILLGAIEHDKLLQSGIYGSADIFVNTSEVETQGISTIEAMASGIVCIGMNKEGSKTLIKNGYNGVLVKSGNKKELSATMIKLLNDKVYYRNIKKNVRKSVGLLDINKISVLWEREYLKLIKGKIQ